MPSGRASSRGARLGSDVRRLLRAVRVLRQKFTRETSSRPAFASSSARTTRLARGSRHCTSRRQRGHRITTTRCPPRVRSHTPRDSSTSVCRRTGRHWYGGLPSSDSASPSVVRGCWPLSVQSNSVVVMRAVLSRFRGSRPPLHERRAPPPGYRCGARWRAGFGATRALGYRTD